MALIENNRRPMLKTSMTSARNHQAEQGGGDRAAQMLEDRLVRHKHFRNFFTGSVPGAHLLERRAARIVCTLSASSSIGTLSNTFSVLGLGFATTSCLSARYPIRVLVRGSTFARIRVVASSRLTIAANGLTSCVLDAICLA
jgi:hypothetical protein